MNDKEERIKEICGILDGDIYWKDCNFLSDLDDDNGIPTFYNRDLCKTISFRELLLWYLPQLGECDIEECESYTEREKVKEIHCNLFMELVDIYAYYTQREYSKYKDLFDDLKDSLFNIFNKDNDSE